MSKSKRTTDAEKLIEAKRVIRQLRQYILEHGWYRVDYGRVCYIVCHGCYARTTMDTPLRKRPHTETCPLASILALKARY